MKTSLTHPSAILKNMEAVYHQDSCYLFLIYANIEDIPRRIYVYNIVIDPGWYLQSCQYQSPKGQ